ncbi:Hypothetical protein PAS_chr1-1_0387 [Komagataella phaffii GS115]|uniref:Uncharacterized protein n=1 Tax=Komagataella phaffii (strain GS115 / ATCC 20864) TaxID=644223 RepID=C4QWZ1_KOMPG|nr:Hypothetical protein PAS_chr1-1_0387 [Komagataella phaffii GS115]CAY67764.1 Hypothetical protein PAS_chr1-1_0387 [Komagataella phaffii GS115]
MMLESVFSDDDEELLDEQESKPVEEEAFDKSLAEEELNSELVESAEFAPKIEKVSKEPLSENESGVEMVGGDGSLAELPSSETPMDLVINDFDEQSKDQQASGGVPATISNSIVDTYSSQKASFSLETANQGYDPFANSISENDDQFEIERIMGHEAAIDVSKPNEFSVHSDQKKNETTRAPGLMGNLSLSEDFRGTEQLEAEAIESNKKVGKQKNQTETTIPVLEIKDDITTHSFPENHAEADTSTANQECDSINNDLSTKRITGEVYDPFQPKSNETYDPFSSESQNGQELFNLACKNGHEQLSTKTMEEKTLSSTEIHETYDPFNCEHIDKPYESLLDGSDVSLSSPIIEQELSTSLLDHKPTELDIKDERESLHSISDELITFNPEISKNEYSFLKNNKPTAKDIVTSVTSFTSQSISNHSAELTLNTKQMIQDNLTFDAQVRPHIHQDGSSERDTSFTDHDLHAGSDSVPRVTSNPHFESKDQTAVKNSLFHAKLEETTGNNDGSLIGQVENTSNHERPSSVIVSREPRFESEAIDKLRLKVQRLEADLQSAEELHHSLQVENSRLNEENASLLLELQELRLKKFGDPVTLSSDSGENLRNSKDPAPELDSNVIAGDDVEEDTKNADAKNIEEQFLTEKEAVESSIKIEDDLLDNIPKNSLDSTRSQLKSSSSFQRFNTYNVSSDYVDSLDVKERLVQWRNWNVDMRAWKSAGFGPVFEM